MHTEIMHWDIRARDSQNICLQTYLSGLVSPEAKYSSSPTSHTTRAWKISQYQGRDVCIAELALLAIFAHRGTSFMFGLPRLCFMLLTCCVLLCRQGTSEVDCVPFVTGASGIISSGKTHQLKQCPMFIYLSFFFFFCRLKQTRIENP